MVVLLPSFKKRNEENYRVMFRRISQSSAGLMSCAALSRQLRFLNHFSGSAEDFTREVATGGVVVDFYTDWCGPCKAIAPEFERLSKESGSSVKFIKVNVEENEEVGALHDVRSIPTFVGFRDGKMIGRIEGADKGKLKDLTGKAAGKAAGTQ